MLKKTLLKNRANFGRSQFVLSDARAFKKISPDAPLRELSCVTYTKNVLPRVLFVAIPNTSLLDNDVGVI